MFSKKHNIERCKYCRRFLTDEQKAHNKAFCTLCARGVIEGIKKSFVIRGVLGIICIAAVFMFIHHMRLNALEYDHGFMSEMHVPIMFGRYITYRMDTFNAIMNFTIAQQVTLAALVFMMPFARRVRFGMDSYYTFSRQYSSNAHASDHPYLIQGGDTRGNMDRLGMLISELFISVISGPFFFVHGTITIARISSYAKGRDV